MQSIENTAIRSLCLFVMTARSQIENQLLMSNANQDQVKQSANVLKQWAEHEGIIAKLSAEERQSFQREIGSWEEELIRANFWRQEGLAVLLWACGYLETMPPFDDATPFGELYDIVPHGQHIETFMQGAQFRPMPELEKALDKAMFLNWRARTEMLKLQGMTPPGGESYKSLIKKALQSLASAPFKVPNDGRDLIIRGKRLADLSLEKRGTFMSVAYERHLALNWMMGPGTLDWDEAHAST